MVTRYSNVAGILTNEDTPETLLALLLTPGVGAVTIHRVRAMARAMDESLASWLGQAESRLIRRLPPGAHREAKALAACGPGLRVRATGLIARSLRAGAEVVCEGAPGYPAALRQAAGRAAPPLLFLRGNSTLFGSQAAGIVGTRTPTPAGREMAARCACVFAALDTPVVSGAAEGVDTAGHLAALEADGASIAILPQGILTYTPSPAFEAALSEDRLLLVSEFPPDALWQRHNAIARNATISALSHVLCVIEPHKEGGSLQTARHALRSGKPVFFLPRPGPIPSLLDYGHAQPLPASIPELSGQLEAAFRRPNLVRGRQGLFF